ncbi:major facilitator superfamily transporter [Colletotrichum karsti]|uniref:Major facilitator superfamily transporter n=1 Tax=Colletotrichum karsti TaxID=1095194 RepID=A0A9P6LNM0_9PEZI|nr:major facilitator superfamily transporter [Colletotrichum karsti]KAF9880063.1 major facilitator superfamily transporter [Colletotrichum karsti]
MSSHSEHTLSEVPTRVDELPPDLLALRTSNAEKGVNILAQTPSRPFSYREDETVYAKFTPKRKALITAIVSFGGLGINLAALLVLSALPEVATAFNTTGTVINYSNALFLLIMGIGVLFWGPLSQVYGRKWVFVSSTVLFCAFSLATAVSPNLAAFFIFRSITAFGGTCFLVVGSSCLSDVYRPTERGTALGWFLGGTLIGPAFGPFLGGVIVTYSTWESLFWFQGALGGVAMILAIAFLPETSHGKWSEELEGLSAKEKVAQVWEWTNPFRVISLFRYPKILIVLGSGKFRHGADSAMFNAGIAASSIMWNMQVLLTPVRYVINPRFNLTSPLQSGFFFLAPGTGYLIGTFFGGPFADHTVKKWIKKRGKRVPEDRLRSAFIAMGLVIPGSAIIYGWAIDKAKGGIPLPVIMMFTQGLAQMICFPCLNSYCLDVFRDRASEVMASNYFIRYTVAAIATAVCLPGVQGIGVGWFSTRIKTHKILSAFSTSAPNTMAKSVESQQDGRPSINIRPATLDDTQAIAELGCHVFSVTFGHSVEPHELKAFLDESYSLEAVAKDLSDPNKDTILATDLEGDILGFAMLTRGSTEPCVADLEATVELQRIYLYPKAHGTGTAKALADRLEDMAREQGFKNIWLGVWEENFRARKAYEKWGYKRVGTHDFVVGSVVQTDDILTKQL